MLFFYAILVVVGVCFSADWSDLATKPSQVQVDGKLFYEISSAKELAWFSNEVASGKTDANAVLKNDIVLWDSLSGDTNYWTPIGLTDSLAFEGVFDGAEKRIVGARSEFSLRGADSVFNGFFRYVGKNGTVKNLTLENSLIKSNHLGLDTVFDYNKLNSDNFPKAYSVVGGIVGVNKGVVDGVRFVNGLALALGSTSTRVVSVSPKATVNAYIMNYIVGGIVGLNFGTVKQTSVNGLGIPSHGMTTIMYMGGIVGVNKGLVVSALNESRLVDSSPSMLGGICGQNDGEIEDVKMSGDMATTDGMVGGIVADNQGSVTLAEYTGSIGYSDYGYGATLGGIAALNHGKISRCYYGALDQSNVRISSTVKGYDIATISVGPEAYAGGIAARQSDKGSIEDCGVSMYYIGLSTSHSKTGTLYTAGLVGIDSGSVYNSYAAYNLLMGQGHKSPLYNISSVVDHHEGNYYDSVYLSAKFPTDTSGLEKSLMRSPKYSWMLNTKNGTETSRDIWCYDGFYPLLVRDGRAPTYRIVRYNNGNVFDTVYTDCRKHAVWGNNVPDDGNGKSLARWEFRNGNASLEVPLLYEFQGDTSVYAVLDSKESLSFTVKFLNYNDTILQELKDVAYGTLPEYTGADLFRDSTGLKYRYTFKGWSPEVTEVLYDQVYKAVYDSSVRKYRVDYEAVCAGRIKKSNQLVTYGENASLCKSFYGSSCSDSLYEYVYRGLNVNCNTFIVLSDTTVYAVFDTIPLPSSSSITEQSSSSENMSSSSKTDLLYSKDGIRALKFNVDRRTVHLDGVENVEPVYIFDLQGCFVKKAFAVGGRVTMPLDMSGSYILRYKSRVYRFQTK